MKNKKPIFENFKHFEHFNKNFERSEKVERPNLKNFELYGKMLKLEARLAPPIIAAAIAAASFAAIIIKISKILKEDAE